MTPALIDQICNALSQPNFWVHEFNRSAILVRENLAALDDELASRGPSADLMARRDQAELDCRFLSVGAGLALPSFNVPQDER